MIYARSMLLNTDPEIAFTPGVHSLTLEARVWQSLFALGRLDPSASVELTNHLDTGSGTLYHSGARYSPSHAP
jgi:hypothetical protein